MRKIPQRSLTIFLLVSSLGLAAPGNGYAAPPVASCDVVGCRCYEPAALTKIAGAITDLKKCQFDLGEKDKLIANRLENPTVDRPHTAWWQEPSVVLGGVVLTASVATLGTLWVVHKK